MPRSGAVQPELLVMEETWGPGDSPKGLGSEAAWGPRPLSLQVGEWAWAGCPQERLGPSHGGQKGWGPPAAGGHSSPTRPSLLPLRLRTFSGCIPPAFDPRAEASACDSAQSLLGALQALLARLGPCSCGSSRGFLEGSL